MIIPDIKQYYDTNLLLRQMSKFSDDLETIMEMYRYIEKLMIKKIGRLHIHNLNTLEKFQKIEQEFLEIYERQKTKEENSTEKAKNKTQEPFYSLRNSERCNKKLLHRLRLFKYRVPSDYRSLYEVSKV